ncbi:MAG: methenyltetrahydromethanopterin cyclohydrolase [Candidatus Hydrothermarchaeota archaeon]|nr:MAG: methenyltetrahydromethanopterin cyclohydrolase [Candidatus Hydrothermarchaeota archaeon]
MILNERAVEIAEELIKAQEKYKVKVIELNKAKVIDCGIEAEGSLEAGRLFSLACLGGEGEVKITLKKYEDLSLPSVEVYVDHPQVCLACQKAAWKISSDKFFALGSGPARLLAEKKEQAEHAVIAMEASKYPDEEVIKKIAIACDVARENLYILIASTSSIVGRVQVAARSVETALYKLEYLGRDIQTIEHAFGVAPIAPLLGDDMVMLGLTNDMIIYASSVYLSANKSLPVEKIPSSTSSAYGKSFLEILKEANYDFYKLPKEIFAPAEIYVNDKEKKKLLKAGRINIEMLKKCLRV